MIHVMTVVGTRPELIRLSVLIPKLDKWFKHTLVHTGQNYDFELNQVFFEDLTLRQPDVHLDAAGKNYAETIAGILLKGDELLRQKKPDAILILGDTNSALIAIVAKRQGIPIFHMEAGNRCFNSEVPEEINRKIVDHIADVNLPYSRIAREYLLREGVHPQSIICTGSPMKEVLERFAEKTSRSDVLGRLNIKKDSFFLVSCHREENVDSIEELRSFVELLRWLIDRFQLPVVLSAHPRTRSRLERYGFQTPSGVQLMPPFSFTDYVKLQTDSYVVLSDSGTITEEAALLRFRAINIRRSHERPEGMEAGVLPLCGFSKEKIEAGIALATSEDGIHRQSYNVPTDYVRSDCSNIVINAILSYYKNSTHLAK